MLHLIGIHVFVVCYNSTIKATSVVALVEYHIMSIQKLIPYINAVYKESFPNSYIEFDYLNLGGVSCFITMLLQQPEDCAHSIPHNDPMRTVFEIRTHNGKLVADLVIDGYLMLSPTSKNTPIPVVKCEFNKSAGDIETIMFSFSQYIKQRKLCINTHKEKIYNVDRIDKKYFV